MLGLPRCALRMGPAEVLEVQPQALRPEFLLAVAALHFVGHLVPPVLALDDGVRGEDHIGTR